MRRLIVNADDFGRSHSINEAVIRAHRDGILTTASLMVGGEGFAEAVELARQNPRLGVGLHLTLICGHAVSPPNEIPGLVDRDYRFTDNPVRAGWRYFADRSLRAQLETEIGAQFTRFRQTNLPLDHLNGHLHLHLHPTVLRILESRAGEWGITHVRLTRDPVRPNLQVASGRWVYRLGHALLFWGLVRHARPVVDRLGWRHTSAVFGLLQDSHVDENFLQGLLPRLPGGDSELYCHPSLDQFRHELEALLSPRVGALVERQGIQLIRYRDL